MPSDNGPCQVEVVLIRRPMIRLHLLANSINEWYFCAHARAPSPQPPALKASDAHAFIAWPMRPGLRAHALAPAPQGLRAHAPRCKEPDLGILAPKARGQGCRHPPKEERPRTHDCSSQGPEALRTSGPGSSGAWNPGVLDWVWIPVSGHGGAM